MTGTGARVRSVRISNGSDQKVYVAYSRPILPNSLLDRGWDPDHLIPVPAGTRDFDVPRTIPGYSHSAADDVLVVYTVGVDQRGRLQESVDPMKSIDVTAVWTD